MRFRAIIFIFGVIGILALTAAAALAAGPVANPEGVLTEERGEIPAAADKAFGDPTDFKAAALAGANYLRYMQADVTEDNAGNGDPDQDLQDAGWDWVLTAFEHSAGNSPSNVHGVTALGLYEAYLLDPNPQIFIAMKDVADHAVAIGPVPPYPTGLHYAGDIMFLLKFATLPGVTNPADYQNAALAVWDWRLVNTGTGTAASVAEAIRDSRHGQGYDNGIIPWDVSAYVDAVMQLDAVFPGNGYAADAAAMAEVLWQDSFNHNPDYFDVLGRNQGFDPTWANKDYWWYNLGVSGLIRSFATAGVHPAEVATLEALLYDSQYPDSAFSDGYGADTTVNDRDWQTTAYVMMALHENLPGSAANLAALYGAGSWLAATQDVSGGFVYGSGNHYPEMGSEATRALAYAWTSAAASLNTTATGADPAQCGATKTVTFAYDRSDGTPGLFGYEVVLQITGPVTPVIADDFVVITSMDFFQTIDNGGGQFTVNGTRFGSDPGILTDADLFKVDLVTSAGGTVNIDILSYRFRDPDNVSIFADMNGMSFVVDCTAPGPVADITAAPRHNKVDVTWTHDGSDTATYEIYRGLWYDSATDESAYPEYDDLAGSTIPTRPTDLAGAIASAQWAHAGSVAAGTFSFPDMWLDETDRGVYYYEVFAVDAAGNGSSAAADNDRATNYWLGDVPPYIDGFVAVGDITVLGSCMGTSHGGGSYNNHCDVGPTDDASSVGIPETDDLIDFEDLMIFSINYGVVGPAKRALPISQIIDLAWVQKDDGRWALHLVGGTGLKGVHVRANVSVINVTAGDLLAAQPEMTFLVNTGAAMDVNLALMGRDLGFVGTGELFVLEAAAAVSPEDLSIDVRGTDNSKLDYTLDKIGGADTPKIFNLGANYPNPFNPMTKINFSLPEAQDVMLAVYSLDGRKVATLLNEMRAAGPHEVVWMGRNDAGQAVASGTYFYRIDAGPHSQVRKMTLMK